jgi:uncharacterized protein (TIGR02996 family)
VTDRDTLLAAVLADPSDDTARLVLADLLRESDNPEERARRRFLWAGVTASRYRGEGPIEDCLYYEALAEIAAVAADGFPARWLADLGLGPRPLAPGDWAWDRVFDPVTVRVGGLAAVFERGLLAGLSVTLGEWYEVAAAALGAWPLELVSVTDAPGLTFAVGRLAGGWRLGARLRVPPRSELRVEWVGDNPRAVPAVAEPAAEWRVAELFGGRRALGDGPAQGA